MTEVTTHPTMIEIPGGQELSEGGEGVGWVDAVAADDVEPELEVDSVQQDQEEQPGVEHGSVYWCGDFYCTVMSS